MVNAQDRASHIPWWHKTPWPKRNQYRLISKVSKFHAAILLHISRLLTLALGAVREGAGSRLRKGMLLFYCVYLTALYLLQISYQSFIFLQSASTHICSKTYWFRSEPTYRSEAASFVRTTDRREVVVALVLCNGWFSRGDGDHERILCDSLPICTDGVFLTQSNGQAVRLHDSETAKKIFWEALRLFMGVHMQASWLNARPAQWCRAKVRSGGVRSRGFGSGSWLIVLFISAFFSFLKKFYVMVW